MGIFGTRTVQCPAGKWTTIISNFGTGMPKTFNVRFSSVSGAVSGRFIERKYLWIFPKPSVDGVLAPNMTFQRDWINGVYSVQILPDTDLVAEID